MLSNKTKNFIGIVVICLFGSIVNINLKSSSLQSGCKIFTSDKTKCQECSNGYDLSDGGKTCKQCTMNCYSCENGKNGCKTCKDISNCSTCQNGWAKFRESNKGIWGTKDMCAYDLDSEASCASDEYRRGSLGCKKCNTLITGCNQCPEDSKGNINCKSCESGYTMSWNGSSNICKKN